MVGGTTTVTMTNNKSNRGINGLLDEESQCYINNQKLIVGQPWAY